MLCESTVLSPTTPKKGLPLGLIVFTLNLLGSDTSSVAIVSHDDPSMENLFPTFANPKGYLHVSA